MLDRTEKPAFQTPDNLTELVFQISARPAMFAGSWNFLSVASFIEGFVFAREKFGVTGEWETIKEFSLWLSSKFDRPKNWGWAAIMNDYLRDDIKAIEELPKLFSEFLDSK